MCIRDRRTSSFSCQACRAKKVKCDKTFPCANCLKFKLDCVPQTRKRGRPERTSEKDLNDRPYEKFKTTIERAISEVYGFVAAVPDVASGSRILDFLKSHTMRRQCRHEFLQAADRLRNGNPLPADYFQDWFGMEPLLDVAFQPGISTSAIATSVKHHFSGIMHKLGVADASAFTGPFQPRKLFEAELADRAWVPQSIRELITPTSFPGALVMVDYQVNAHSSYSVNQAFGEKFFTATEMMLPGGPPHFCWGGRKVFHLEDLGHYIGDGVKECLALKKRPEDPLLWDGMIRTIDKHGSTCMCYMRRYYWLELGGERSCTVHVLYEVRQPCRHLAQSPTQQAQATKSKNKVTNSAVAKPSKSARPPVDPLPIPTTRSERPRRSDAKSTEASAQQEDDSYKCCLLYTSPSPRDS
eukprot:TRINITY_DN4236_c0_g1_i3.p1 TRINITY_DN4236_c0_g1~~TRINITY_DN4236_c0_g1_i3.p1  ORF type:complete len:412 (-),score=100.95 TRINITY_DN4236_c0_g1_i3:151-1386(-)